MPTKPSKPSKPSKSLKKSVDLSGLPGHQIRRLQQIAVAIFLQETGETGLTPVQYAALQAASNQPDIDQRTLARLVGLDTSTLAGVIDRLEKRGLVQRKPDARDRRLKLVSPTPEGHQALAQMVPAMLRAQERILAPLTKADRREFTRMLDALVTANNDLSRAPSGGKREAYQEIG